MEEVYGQRAVFVVIAKYVGFVVLLDGGNALFLLQLVDCGELITQARGGFELLSFSGGYHACGERTLQFCVLAFKEELHISNGVCVNLRRGEAFNTRAQAAVNVVLQTGTGMVAGEIDLATGNEKAAMDELDDAVGQVAGKVWAVVGCAVLAQAAGDKDLGKAVGKRQLDVGVGLVVAQQNVEARLALLDQVVFKCQRFVLIGDENVVQIDGFAHQ